MAVSVWEYAAPTVPFGNALVLILRGVIIVIDNDFVAVTPVRSVTLKVTEVGPPAAVGVPEITPLELSDSPAGNEPDVIDQV